MFPVANYAKHLQTCNSANIYRYFWVSQKYESIHLNTICSPGPKRRGVTILYLKFYLQYMNPTKIENNGKKMFLERLEMEIGKFFKNCKSWNHPHTYPVHANLIFKNKSSANTRSFHKSLLCHSHKIQTKKGPKQHIRPLYMWMSGSNWKLECTKLFILLFVGILFIYFLRGWA